MKKINLLFMGIIAMFGFMVTAYATDGVSLKCDDNEILIGQTTNCTVSITTDTAVTATTIKLDTSEHLLISNITANTNAGWSASATETNASTGNYAFNYSSTSGSTGNSAVFSFSVTLSDSAKKLSEGDSCGQLCIAAVGFNGSTQTEVLKGTGTCFSPTVVIEECTGENCNPQTGTFMNYLIIVSVGVIAIAAILIVRRSSKFYRV